MFHLRDRKTHGSVDYGALPKHFGVIEVAAHEGVSRWHFGRRGALVNEDQRYERWRGVLGGPPTGVHFVTHDRKTWTHNDALSKTVLLGHLQICLSTHTLICPYLHEYFTFLHPPTHPFIFQITDNEALYVFCKSLLCNQYISFHGNNNNI